MGISFLYNPMRHDLTHEDFPETLAKWHLDNQRMRERIAYDELTLVETPQPPIPHYTPETKKKMSLIEIIQFPKCLLP